MRRPPMRFVAAAFLILQVVWAGWLIYRASEGGLSMLVYLGYVYGGALFAVTLVVWVVTGVFAASARERRVGRSLGRPAVRFQAAVLVLVFIVVPSDAAFRARLAFSKSALRAVASSAIEGFRSEQSRWIGLFRVHEVDKVNGAVRFITAECGLDDCGVVFSPAGPPPRVGEDSYDDLGGGWWHWHRSW